MKKAKDLTDIAIRAFIKETEQLPTEGAEKHRADGKVPGLSVWVRRTSLGTTVRWKYAYRTKTVNRTFGLGSYPEITLQKARERAAAIRDQMGAGVDPREEKRKREAAARQEREAAAKAAVTVSELFEEFAETRRGNWSRKKDELTEPNRVRIHVLPALGALPVEKVTPADIAAAIKPAWKGRPATAKKVLSMLRKFFVWVTDKGFRENSINPVDTERIELLIGKKGTGAGHQAAMDWRQIPDLFVELSQSKGTAARALMYAILSNVRIENAIGLRWGAVDFDKGEVRYLASDMKIKRNGDFTVYLSRQSAAVLKAQAKVDGILDTAAPDDYVFPSQTRNNRPITNAAVEKLLKTICERRGFIDAKETERKKRPAYPTPHGTARASFRTWVEETGRNRTAAERNLHHRTETSIGLAYNRTDYPDERRKLSQEWADYCFSKCIEGKNEGQKSGKNGNT